MLQYILPGSQDDGGNRTGSGENKIKLFQVRKNEYVFLSQKSTEHTNPIAKCRISFRWHQVGVDQRASLVEKTSFLKYHKDTTPQHHQNTTATPPRHEQNTENITEHCQDTTEQLCRIATAS